jgi:hypothetical protein
VSLADEHKATYKEWKMDIAYLISEYKNVERPSTTRVE